jgi:integrase
MRALDAQYLQDASESPAYCPHCGRPMARATEYLLADAIADYRLEIGDERASADTIAARLKHVVDFLEATNRIEASCAHACVPGFAEAFRLWSKKQPVVWRNKQGAITVSRARSPATTEESILQLVAVLNHAAKEKRSDTRPEYSPIGRKRVTRKRRVRVDVDVLARMLAYAAEPKKQRETLHAFLVGSICTLARPDAVVDISTDPSRRQWWPGSTTIDLNPQLRTQTKKSRPVLPVVPLLDRWLTEIHADANDEKRPTNHWLVNYFGSPVANVESAWETMLKKLSLPLDREWRPYVLRHSLATLMRRRGVPKWELQGFMGHADGSVTETYAVELEFPNVCNALNAIIGELEAMAPGALHRTLTGPSHTIIPLRRRKMP